MELRIPSPEQLRTVYDRDLKEAFPPEELKALRSIEQIWAEGWYRPWCLFDGDSIVGEAFLWLGHPGWALLDYLCVSAGSRNSGLGSVLLQKLREAEADTVIFGESEAPEGAPDPELAERRLRHGDVRRPLQDAVPGCGRGERGGADAGAPLCVRKHLRSG